MLSHFDHCKTLSNIQGLGEAFPLMEMRVTYIQPVFDCRVQHGQVCEEDTQVGHSALGTGLCRKKKNPTTIKVRFMYSQRFQFAS